MTRKPRPEDIKLRLERLQNRIPIILKNWRWARRLGYDKQLTTDEVLVSGSSNDPTGTITVGQEHIRWLVESGAEDMLEGTKRIERADDKFAQALSYSDNRSPRVRELDLPDEPWIGKRDHRRLKQSQERRVERGEDVP